MDFTPRLGLPFIAAQQAQKQVTYNEAMKALDALVQLAVLSRTTAAPPGSPAEGDGYIVPAAATGGWSGKDHRVAVYLDGAWSFYTAQTGWLAYVVDAAEIVIFGASTWDQFVTTGGSALSTLGINATADLTNRLAVAADASLFSHDGADHRMTLNKAAAGDTASLLFQQAFSGRAEFGLAGDDDFHVKVSPDGSSWTEALTIARATGQVSLPTGQLAFPASQNPSAGANVLDDYDEGVWTPTLAFGGASTGIAYDATNHGRYTKIGRVCVANGLLFLTSKGSATGSATIGGLPFTTAGGTNNFQSASVGYASALTGFTGPVSLLANVSDTTLVVGYQMSGSAGFLTDAHFTNGSHIYFTLVYETA